jgi:diheme cytochrome c
VRKSLSLLIVLLVATPAFAYRLPPVSDNKVNEECGACHMVYQSQMLPSRSWQAITSNLANHFGEDASIADAAVLQRITDYLMLNSGDATGVPRGILKGLSIDETPLRITELPLWVAIHSEEVSARTWKRVGSKSNCTACHRSAADGNYGGE